MVWILPLILGLGCYIHPITSFSIVRIRKPTCLNTLRAAGERTSPSSTTTATASVLNDKNRIYIQGLQQKLGENLDKWILTGNPTVKVQAFNLLEQIQRQSHDDEAVQQAQRQFQRAGLPLPEESQSRRDEAQKRKEWEEEFQEQQAAEQQESKQPRSALSRRARDGKPDLLMKDVDPRLDKAVKDKVQIENIVNGGGESEQTLSPPPQVLESKLNEAAATKVSEWIAQAWNPDYCGNTIGGLDEVLSQVKRRIWTPLAAPPVLLEELGIHPVRGLLLYGRPGCGKTLVARTLGRILSPLRPTTIVSGPEIMDKFVGSSEKNLREVFDNPPDIYDRFRIGEPDNGDALAKAALHVIVLDEFDAIARARGGGGKASSSQGDAGVARDSVVNQMLAKMDGVDPLAVPTLVIGLTNRRSLIEPALLRPGRFEVQIEVPPPKTTEQRVSILRVHTRHMHAAGRLLVQDAPQGGAAAALKLDYDDLFTYDQLLEYVGERCDGFSGASLAGVARAAASHALERAVKDYSNGETGSLLEVCVVTSDDFEEAIKDVVESAGTEDWEEDNESETSDNVEGNGGNE